MHETLKRREAHDPPAGKSADQLDLPPHKIKHDKHRQHAEHGDAADPAQRDLVPVPPVAALRLLDDVGLGVRDRAAALNALHFLE